MAAKWNIKTHDDFLALSTEVREKLREHLPAEITEGGTKGSRRGPATTGPWRPEDPASKTMIRQRLIAARLCLNNANYETVRVMLDAAIKELQ